MYQFTLKYTRFQDISVCNPQLSHYINIMFNLPSITQYILPILFCLLFPFQRQASSFLMAQDKFSVESVQRRTGLLKDQVRLVKRKDSDRYEIFPIQDKLSNEKGFFVVIRACQLLAQKNDGLILVGLAGPSGAGKTVFTEKILNFMPSIAVISMDNYNDASRVIDGNFDGKILP